MRVLAFILLAAVLTASCRSTFSRKYEYEEEVYLALDGSATVYVNASVAALVALRGLNLDVNPRARLDRFKVRDLYESPASHVASVSASRRSGRRYVHLRLHVSDITRLSEAAPFAWARYALTRENDLLKYREIVGPPVGRDVGDVGWTGAELVAIRLHLPSNVVYHNAPSKAIERGNIGVWEQTLADRLRAQPIDIQIDMETRSILARTLLLFAAMVVLAAATFALVIWFVKRL